jgi:hypothetical protein
MTHSMHPPLTYRCIGVELALQAPVCSSLENSAMVEILQKIGRREHGAKS